MIADLAFPAYMPPDFHNASFDAIFALRVVKWVGLLSLVGFAYAKCIGWDTSGVRTSQRRTFFGFRIGLLFATFNGLLTVIALAVVGATDPESVNIGIPRIISTLVDGIIRAMMSYAVIRIALYPLRAADISHIDKKLAIITAIGSSIASITLVTTTIGSDGQVIAQANGVDLKSEDVSMTARTFITMALIDSIIYVLIGAVSLAAGIYALFRSKTLDVHPEVARATKYMVAAAAVWFSSGIIFAAVTGYEAAPWLQMKDGGVDMGSFLITYSPTLAPALHAVDLVVELTIWTIFVLCFRSVNEKLPY